MRKKRKTVKYTLYLLLCLLSAAALAGCAARQDGPLTRTDFKLDTAVTVSIYDRDADPALLDGCMELIGRYEKLFSRTSPDSELYRLNHGLLPKSGDGYEVSGETAELILLGLSYGELSDGAFDITIGPVSSLWDFRSGEPSFPDPAALSRALELVDWRNVRVKDNHVAFLKEGMELDLGALAKGYIADRLKDYLESAHVHSALITLGGNVLCVGSKPGGDAFRIGIQKPFAARNETAASVPCTDRSVVSSGIYERYFEYEGKRYHHILDPSTGFPYENGLTAVTILSDTSAEGDALSTVCFSLGLQKGLALVNSLENVEAIFITGDGELIYSEKAPAQDQTSRPDA